MNNSISIEYTNYQNADRALIRAMFFYPTLAFALTLPTMGYYTFASFISWLEIRSTAPMIAYRALAVAICIYSIYWIFNSASMISKWAIPGLIFLFFYTLRLLENIWIQNLTIEPGNAVATLTLLVGTLPAVLLLTCSWHHMREREARIIFSVLAIIFVVFSWFSLPEVSRQLAYLKFMFRIDDYFRYHLSKVNPIALAYTCSTFLIYYYCIFRNNLKSIIEAVILSPFLIYISLSAQSRGMLISTFLCIVLAFYLKTKEKKIFNIVYIILAIILTVFLLDYSILDTALSALQRIDVVTDRSTALRVLAWKGSLQQFWADPLIGRYVIERVTNYYPHNIYLESLISVGLLGSLFFSAHIFISLKSAFYILKSNEGNWVWTFISILFLREFVASAASGSVWGNAGFWLSSFLVIAISAGLSRGEAAIAKPPSAQRA